MEKLVIGIDYGTDFYQANLRKKQGVDRMASFRELLAYRANFRTNRV